MKKEATRTKRQQHMAKKSRTKPTSLTSSYPPTTKKPSTTASTASSKEKVYTAHKGVNAELIRNVCNLYVKDGDVVADVTYGKGAFWKATDTDRFNLKASDILTCKDAPYDLTDLPYDNASLDHFVLDPPYMHTPSKPMVDKRYRNSETTLAMYHGDIMAKLYAGGMIEARRTLKNRGMLWVKCQDEIQSSKQVWSHIELYNMALAFGFYAKDMFVLLSNSQPPVQAKQQHARRNHSYLWIFEKKPQ